MFRRAVQPNGLSAALCHRPACRSRAQDSYTSERQGGVDTARVIEVAIDQTVERMAQLEPAAPAGSVRITHVDGAAVGKQMIEFLR